MFRFASGVSPDLAARMAIGLFCRPRRPELTQRQREILAEATTVTFASGRVGHRWGTGPTILLCHGWESRGARFTVLIRALVSQGFEVLTWDAPAHGASPGKRTHLPHIAQCLAEDLQSEGIQPVGAVGHSLGGAVLGLLDQLHGLPEKVAFIAAPTRIDEVFRRYFALIQLGDRAQQRFVDFLMEETGFPFERLNLVSSPLSQKRTVLVVHDRSDKEIPFADFEILNAAWSKAQFEATEGLGHRRILDDERVVTLVSNHFARVTATEAAPSPQS